ncbi:SSK1, response regulator [Pisolithus marmoratus]|nr:SSK1, response regulator [Pisolithus marmoratus]
MFKMQHRNPSHQDYRTPYLVFRAQRQALQSQNDSLRTQLGRSEDRVRGLERCYKDVLGEMVHFQRNLAQQDALLQSLVQYFLRSEGVKHKDSLLATSIAPGPAPPTSALPSNFQQAQGPHTPAMPPPTMTASLGHTRPVFAATHCVPFAAYAWTWTWSTWSTYVVCVIISTFSGTIAKSGSSTSTDASTNTIPVSMNEMSRRAGAATDMASTTGTGSVNGSDMTSGDAPFLIPPDTSWDGTVQTGHEGLQVFTLGHLLPRSALDDANGNWTYGGDIPDGNGSADVVDGIGVCEGEGFEKEESPGAEEVVQPTPTNPGVRESSSGTSGTAPSSSGGGQKLRVRRSTFVPGWAVPPRVLLVDDDAVSRRLSSKFLQVFGCAIDVAVDGVGAVNKMNLEKYDLVLMDIVMPKMDGISATSLIRRFDHITPIISMTSNSRPAEIMTYYSSGMKDVLPKPFTKEGLLDMLEKHLRHLKVIQEMSRVPRMPCGPRLSTENSLTDALVPASTTSSATPSTTSPSSSATTVTYSGTEGDEIGPPSQSGNAEDIDGDGSGLLFMGGVGTDIRIDPLAGMGLTEERYQAILHDLVSGENLNGVGVPEGFGFDMMGDESIGMGVDVNVEEMSGGMSSDMGMGEKRGLEEESDGIREVKRGRFEVLD